MQLFHQQSRMSTDSNGQSRQSREILGVDGIDGGELMTPQQIKTALKIHKAAQEKEDDFDGIAKLIGLDIDKMAL